MTPKDMEIELARLAGLLGPRARASIMLSRPIGRPSQFMVYAYQDASVGMNESIDGFGQTWEDAFKACEERIVASQSDRVRKRIEDLAVAIFRHARQGVASRHALRTEGFTDEDLDGEIGRAAVTYCDERSADRPFAIGERTAGNGAPSDDPF